MRKSVKESESEKKNRKRKKKNSENNRNFWIKYWEYVDFSDELSWKNE